MTSLHDALDSFRSRLRLLLFLRTWVLVFAMSGTAAAFWSVASAPSGASRAASLLASLVAASCVASVWAIWRAPSLATTASLIDRALGLPHHIAAAWQVSRDDSAMAALVVRDGMRRLADVRPADVFPLDVRRQTLTAVVVAGVACVVVAAGVSRTADAVAPLSAGTGGVVPQQGEPGRQTTGSTEELAQNPLASQAGEPQAPTQAQASTPQASGETQNIRKVGGPAHEDGATATASARVNSQSPRGGAADASSTQATPSTLRKVVDAPGLGTPRVVTADGNSAASTYSGSEAPGGGGAATSSKAGRGSGGVSTGSLREPAPSDAVRDGTPASRHVVAVSVAQAQADAALTRDDIPPGFRRYVRDYFLRLRATGQQ